MEIRRPPALPQVPKSGLAPEPGITDETYGHILQFIRHQGRTFERTPSTYAVHGEEDLRNIILAQLNGHFHGDAVGEAFRRKGKTDICIEQDNRAAFVGECKLWTGAAGLTAAMDQLLGYLTWRDSKAALIMFTVAPCGRRTRSSRAEAQGLTRNLSWGDRVRLAPTRIGAMADYHLGWRRGSVLNRVSEERADASVALARATRDARAAFGDQVQGQLGETLDIVAATAKELGIPIGENIKAMLDAHSVSFSGGTIYLHDERGVPLRGLGIGSTRLLIAGLQRKAAAQSSIILIDELEHGRTVSPDEAVLCEKLPDDAAGDIEVEPEGVTVSTADAVSAVRVSQAGDRPGS